MALNGLYCAVCAIKQLLTYLRGQLVNFSSLVSAFKVV